MAACMAHIPAETVAEIRDGHRRDVPEGDPQGIPAIAQICPETALASSLGANAGIGMGLHANAVRSELWRCL